MVEKLCKNEEGTYKCECGNESFGSFALNEDSFYFFDNKGEIEKEYNDDKDYNVDSSIIIYCLDCKQKYIETEDKNSKLIIVKVSQFEHLEIMKKYSFEFGIFLSELWTNDNNNFKEEMIKLVKKEMVIQGLK